MSCTDHKLHKPHLTVPLFRDRIVLHQNHQAVESHLFCIPYKHYKHPPLQDHNAKSQSVPQIAAFHIMPNKNPEHNKATSEVSDW